MSPEDKVTSEPTEVVHAVIIGTGDGNLPLATGTIAVTPAGMSNIATRIITPLMALAVRFGNTFFVSFSGLVGAALVPGTLLHQMDLYHLALASLSIAAADLLKNIVTIFGKLEGKYPLLSGSV